MIDLLKRIWGRSHKAITGRLKKDPTGGYQGGVHFSAENILDNLPPFSLIQAELMTYDPVVQFGLTVRDGALRSAEVKVDGPPHIAKYVARQWSMIWSHYSRLLLRTKMWGFAGFQVSYRESGTGSLEIESLKEFSPHDIRPLRSKSGGIVGLAVKPRGIRSSEDTGGKVRLLMPQALYTTFGARWEIPWGRSILRRSYPAWWKKWMKHGVRDVTRLRMLKDAYRGDTLEVPFNKTAELPDGTIVPWRDIAREMGENMKDGSLVVIPQMVDANGNKLINYTPPQDTGNPVGIWTWGDNTDRDIWRGMDVFEEVIQASETGSGYAGRSIPLMMFLSAVTVEFEELLQAVDNMVLRPLACLQFGREVEYEIQAVSLIDTFAKDVQGSSIGGSGIGTPASAGPEPAAEPVVQNRVQVSPVNGNGAPVAVQRRV